MSKTVKIKASYKYFSLQRLADTYSKLHMTHTTTIIPEFSTIDLTNKSTPNDMHACQNVTQYSKYLPIYILQSQSVHLLAMSFHMKNDIRAKP